MEIKTANILVVDDDPNIAEIIQSALEAEGYIVTLANDGQAALTNLTERKFDLVLLDIKMPGLDGYQVLQSIREKSDIPVIMLSCVLEPDAVAQSLKLGADDYIRKPFSYPELAARVRAKLRRTNPG